MIYPKITLALLLGAATLSSLGCSKTRYYDLSPAPLFGAYSDKEVTLTRPAVLIAYLQKTAVGYETIDSPHTYFTLGYETDDYRPPQLKEPAGSYQILDLPAGTKIHVLYTELLSDNQDSWQSSHLETFYTDVELNLTVSNWPKKVKARFDPAQPPPYVHFEDHVAKIRPAPWEPLETPAERPMKWPSNQYLLKSENPDQK